MDAIEKYKQLYPQQDVFTNKLYSLLIELLHINEINFHIIDKRTKSLESFQEKSKIKNQKYSDPLNEITDLSGLRIILYYQDDISDVIRIIKNEFEIDEANSNYKNRFQNPNEFGYNSAHIIIKPSQERIKLSEWKAFSEFKAEIQIRTVLQHAWASISHALQYKSKEEIPVNFQRQLFRLASLFELADEEFISLRDKHFDLSQKINTIENIENSNINIDLISIEKYINGSTLVEKLFDLALKIGFLDKSTFRRVNEKENYSELITLCHILSIYRISKLHKNILTVENQAENFFRILLQTHYKRREGDNLKGGWYVTKEFIAILLLIKCYSDTITVKNLIEINWNDEIADETIKCAKSGNRN